jgi:putative addiction module killer protein
MKRINARLATAERTGHLGDVKALGEGLWEMRIHTGPGYRLYYVREGKNILILLCGGDKNRQQRDIDLARRMAAERRES